MRRALESVLREITIIITAVAGRDDKILILDNHGNHDNSSGSGDLNNQYSTRRTDIRDHHRHVHITRELKTRKFTDNKFKYQRRNVRAHLEPKLNFFKRNVRQFKTYLHLLFLQRRPSRKCSQTSERRNCSKQFC